MRIGRVAHGREQECARAREVAALRLGIELGMSLIDTAEMYGEGRGRRDCRRSDPWATPRRFSRYESLSA